MKPDRRASSRRSESSCRSASIIWRSSSRASGLRLCSSDCICAICRWRCSSSSSRLLIPDGNMSPYFSMNPLKSGVRPSIRSSSILFSERTMSRTRDRSCPCICWMDPLSLLQPAVDARALGVDDVLDLLSQLLDGGVEVVAAELLLARLTQLFEQLLQALHVRRPPAQQPLQRRVEIAVVHQVVRESIQDVAGVE